MPVNPSPATTPMCGRAPGSRRESSAGLAAFFSSLKNGQYVRSNSAAPRICLALVFDLRGLPAVVASPPVTRRHDRGLLSPQAIFRDDRVP